ncbi:MAG: carbohydrate binding domain-containing protein, partial [Clostridia bacterium]|nr:carbohydrate binding domain-containing protein [Clostridia bacterium]
MLKYSKKTPMFTGRQIVAFLAATIMLFSCFGVLGVAERTSPVQNGDFEQVDSLALPVGWLLMPEGASVSAEHKTVNGTDGGWMRLPASDALAAVQTHADYLIEVEPSTTYELRYEAFATGELIPLVLQYQADGTGCSAGDIEIAAGIVTDTADWTDKKVTFRTSEDAAWIALRFDATRGEAGVDNVDLFGGVYSEQTAENAELQNVVYGSAVVADHNAPNLPAGATNLVQNGDFANNSVWALNNDAGSASIADGMAKLTVSGSTGIDQSINVEAGKTYVISFYTWVTSATNMKTAIQLNGAGLNWALNHSDGYNRVTNGWQENTYTITPTASGSLWFRIRCAWGGVGEFYVDDVVIYCVDDIPVVPTDHNAPNLPAGATNLVQNGDFANNSVWALNNDAGSASIADGMAKLTVSGSTGIDQSINVEAGKTYVISFYTWVTSATNM